MSPESRSPSPQTDHRPYSADETAEDMQYFRRVLRHMVELGDELSDMVVQEARSATADAAPLPGSAPAHTASAAYDRVTTAVRRSIMLYEKITTPKKPVTSRVAARKRIIREVEDAIQRKAFGDHADSLHAELLERLDRPDLDDEIANRPLAEIVTDMCRDLGIAGLPGEHPWKRRMPHDIAILNARAAQLAGASVSAELAALLAAAPPAPPCSGLDPAWVAKLPDEELDRMLANFGHYDSSG